MAKFNWSIRACGIFLLWAATAVALPAQTFTTLYSFNGTDGVYIIAGLVQGTNGNLYGTTEEGGAIARGTVFEITPSGTLTTLYTFCSQSNCTDGQYPVAGLVQGTDGNFYGTTGNGGAGGDGTVFKITPSGTLTTLHSFDITDGEDPRAALIQGTNGNLYGTTYEGGANGYGTVFKITPNGTLTTLHSFDKKSGNYPVAELVQSTDGDVYGTTSAGGADRGGTVFKITPSGKLTTLHSFDVTDGATPVAGLIQSTDGNFYGTTLYGGANGDGTVFEITPSGTLTTLHSFTGGTDGASPYAGLVQDTNGTFYGTTYEGGANGSCDVTGGCGTVFSLSVGLGPFVDTNPTSGKVGKAVKILGTSLTGSTSVTFNGTAATFTVVSASEITTTVPNGATTGTVQVVTPGGTLSSNVPFTVTP